MVVASKALPGAELVALVEQLAEPIRGETKLPAHQSWHIS